MTAVRPVPGTGAGEPVSGEAVRRLLESRLGPIGPAEIGRTFPGHSRDTWIVRCEPAGGGDRIGYVVRVDHPGGPLVPIPMSVEYEVYRRLWGTAIPVAEPLWYAGEDDDPSFAGGRPHMVRRLVDGSSAVVGIGDPGADGDAVRRRVCHEMAEHLARLHTLDWDALGFADVLFVPDADHVIADEIAHWRGLWAEHRTDPFPMLTEATYWLEEQIPAGAVRRSLLKGNNGIGEEIWRDGRVVALSDWELASIGDPAFDWAFSQGLLALHDAEDTLAHYADHAGFAIDREILAWAMVWIRIKASMTTNGGMRAFLDGTDDRLVRPALGIGVVKATEWWVAESLGGDVVALGERLLVTPRGRSVLPSGDAP